MVRIRFRGIALLAYLLFLIPITIFFFGWLRWYYAVLATALIAYGFIRLFRSDYLANTDMLHIPRKHLIGILVVIGLWVACSGNCGIGAGLYDIAWRTVFLQDLIAQPWPVVYQDGYALAYYFVFWLIPALVGKAFGLGAAYVAMWLYEVAILACAAGLFSCILKADRPAVFWMVTIVLLLFSGLNIVGSAVMELIGKNYEGFGLNGNESYCNYFFIGEATNFYYRSNADVIEEIYNQLPFLVAVPLMLQIRKPRAYIFIALMVLPFSPWCCVGLIPLMLALGIIDLVRKVREEGGVAGAKWALREIFSVPNIVALVVIGIVFGTFMVAGTHLSGDNTNSIAPFMGQESYDRARSWSHASGSFGFLTVSAFPIGVWFAYCLFVLCEFLVYSVFMFRKYKRDPFFYVVNVWLMLCPLIWVGTVDGRDFCMNGSLPALCCMMFFIMRYLREEVMAKSKVKRSRAKDGAEVVSVVAEKRPVRSKRVLIWNRLFVIVLAVAFASPVMELCDQTLLLVENHTLRYLTASTQLSTFEGAQLSSVANFVCAKPQDTFFFTYLAK